MQLAQEFYWYNPAKLPSPAQWVTVKRVRVKDAVNPIWWLSKTAHPNASNRRVLTQYTDSMLRLLKKGYNHGKRPSGHNISKKWNKKNAGAIPPNFLLPTNVLIGANTASNDKYLSTCRKLGIHQHPARFVEMVPEFFVQFLTRKGDVVLDPFGGSNVVGYVAEKLGRQWISIDINRDYVLASSIRFPGAKSGIKDMGKLQRQISALDK